MFGAPVFTRRMIGVYQHCGEAHLRRYLAEFDFRYNRRTALKVTDTERHDMLLAMIGDKRLTYRQTEKSTPLKQMSLSFKCCQKKHGLDAR